MDNSDIENFPEPLQAQNDQQAVEVLVQSNKFDF